MQSGFISRAGSQTSKLYTSIIERFLRYNKSPREFLLLRSDKSRSTLRVYYFALKFFFENVLDEKFEDKLPLIKNQLKKASISIMLNISEGYARKSNREFRHFLDYAHGSCAEVQSAMYIALDQKYISQQQFEHVYKQTEEISKMITSFSIYLRNKIAQQKSK